ncbi:MAG TPA: type II toxin-antitoxin system prevent-host-death family antitoxin [Acetobacteraceae bacterium]
MSIVNIHDAKTHFSRLIEKAASGEPVIIAKAGKPVAKLMALDATASGPQRRLGFMAGSIIIPENFDTMGRAEIERLFRGDSE